MVNLVISDKNGLWFFQLCVCVCAPTVHNGIDQRILYKFNFIHCCCRHIFVTLIVYILSSGWEIFSCKVCNNVQIIQKFKLRTRYKTVCTTLWYSDTYNRTILPKAIKVNTGCVVLYNGAVQVCTFYTPSYCSGAYII